MTSRAAQLAALSLIVVSLVACSAGNDEAEASPVAPTATLPTPAGSDTVQPAVTVAPGFTFPPLAKPETRGDAVAYANKLLFERSGRLCMEQNFVEPAGLPDWEAMIAGLAAPTGMLADGRSYVGDLGGALEAFGLEPSGIEFAGVAYGLGKVRADRALPQLPEGAWWLPELQLFTIRDGRTVWYFTGQYFAAPASC